MYSFLWERELRYFPQRTAGILGGEKEIQIQLYWTNMPRNLKWGEFGIGHLTVTSRQGEKLSSWKESWGSRFSAMSGIMTNSTVHKIFQQWFMVYSVITKKKKIIKSYHNSLRGKWKLLFRQNILWRDLGNRYSSFDNILPNNIFLFPRAPFSCSDSWWIHATRWSHPTISK